MVPLTHKERFLRAINHEEADRVPTYAVKYELGFAAMWDECFDVKGERWVPFRQDQTILVELGLDATTDPALGDIPDPEFKFENFKTPEGYTVNATGRVTKRWRLMIEGLCRWRRRVGV